MDKKLLFKITAVILIKVASATTLRGQLWILTADYSNNTMRTKAQTLLTKRGIINKLFLTKTQWKIQVNSSMLYHSIGKLQIEIKIDTNTQHVLWYIVKGGSFMFSDLFNREAHVECISDITQHKTYQVATKVLRCIVEQDSCIVY